MELGATESAKDSKTYELLDFALRVQYKNTLPELTYDTKSIPYSIDTTKFTTYTPTSLEKDYNYELQLDDDALIDINLVNPDLYKVNSKKEALDEIDQLLLKDDTFLELSSKIKPSKKVSWLRRSNLMNIDRPLQKQSTIMERTIASESNVNLYKSKYKTREEQIKAIEKTFEDTKMPITTHHRNKELKPVAFHPVLPDEELWRYTFSHIIFDAQPTVQGKGDSLDDNQLDSALLKGMSDSLGEYVGYFVRNSDLEYSGQPDMAAHEMVREYNWSIQNTDLGATEDVYSWRLVPNHGLVFNELSARVRLIKRRLEGGKLKNNICNTMLMVHRRENTNAEEQEQARKIEVLTKIGSPPQESKDLKIS